MKPYVEFDDRADENGVITTTPPDNLEEKFERYRALGDEKGETVKTKKFKIKYFPSEFFFNCLQEMDAIGVDKETGDIVTSWGDMVDLIHYMEAEAVRRDTRMHWEGLTKN